MADGGGLLELGVLVAQLWLAEAAAAAHVLEPLSRFDLLADLLSTLDRESKVSIRY